MSCMLSPGGLFGVVMIGFCLGRMSERDPLSIAGMILAAAMLTFFVYLVYRDGTLDLHRNRTPKPGRFWWR